VIRAIKVLAFLLLGLILALLPPVAVAQLFLGSWLATVIAIPWDANAWEQRGQTAMEAVLPFAPVLLSFAVCFSCAVALALQAVGGGS
jgi:hypothetical protein